jgi:hypothetical protein
MPKPSANIVTQIAALKIATSVLTRFAVGRPGWSSPSREKPQAQNAGDNQKGGHDIAE